MDVLNGMIQVYRNIATQYLTDDELTDAFDTADQAAAELEEKNELIHQLQNALHVRDTQLESLRAENEKLKTDFVQMTHNCVGAEMEAESLRAEREQLKQAAVLAMRAVEEVAFETLKAHMQKLDSYLANGLSEKLWEEINSAALERVK